MTVSILTTSTETGIRGWLLSKMKSCCGKLSLNELKMLRANSTNSTSVVIRLETRPFASLKWSMVWWISVLIFIALSWIICKSLASDSVLASPRSLPTGPMIRLSGVLNSWATSWKNASF